MLPCHLIVSSCRDFEARRSYTARRFALREAIGHPFDHAMLGAAGGELDRALDRAASRAAVSDHGEPAQAEEIGPAVGVRIELVAHPPRRRTDQEAADLSTRRRRDLRPQQVEELDDRALEELERHVPGEAV